MEENFWMKAYRLPMEPTPGNAAAWACDIAQAINAEGVTVEEVNISPGRKAPSVFGRPFDEGPVMAEISERLGSGRKILETYVKCEGKCGGTRVRVNLALGSGMVFVWVEGFGTETEKRIERIMTGNGRSESDRNVT